MTIFSGDLKKSALAFAKSASSTAEKSYTALKPAYSAVESTYNVLQPVVKKEWEESNAFRQPKEVFKSLFSNDFDYEPLPSPAFIRLLDLKPGTPTDVIQCSLRAVDLSDYPSYIAISYAWNKDKPWASSTLEPLIEGLQLAPQIAGVVLMEKLGINLALEDESKAEKNAQRRNSAATRMVICNGKRMNVQENLYDCLLRLRTSGPGTYWIDAVCIQQKDTDERNAQVAMMGDIYRNAKQVIVWLGTCPAILSPGLEVLKNPESQLPRFKAKGYSLKPAQPESVGSLRTYLGALYLLTRRWFRRVWVLQEACLAQDIVFFLDEHQLNPQDLLRVIDWFDDPATIEHEDSNHANVIQVANTFLPRWGAHIRYIRAILESRDKNFMNNNKWTLRQWLEICKGRKTTDPRDIVYGGFGLIQRDSLRIDQDIQAKDTRTIPEIKGNNETVGDSTRRPELGRTTGRLWTSIQANYKSRTSDLLLNIAACLLSQSRGIDLLSIASRLRNEEGSNMGDDFLRKLPTWVPNPSSWSSRVLETFNSLGDANFTTCTHSSNDALISADGTTLSLDAAKLGVIEDIGPGENFVLGEPNVDRLLSLLDFIAELEPAYKPTGQHTIEVLSHVFIAGLWQRKYPPPSETLRGFLLFLDSTVQYSSHWLEAGHQQNMLDNEETTETEELQKLKEAYEHVKTRHPHHDWPAPDVERNEADLNLQRQFESAQSNVSAYRRLFVTTEGYLGLGPTWLHEDDVVMIVKGGYVPYIFAPVEADLERRIACFEEMKECNTAWAPKVVMQGYDEKIKEIREESIGKEGAWLLVGEAYVEGVMNGECESKDIDFERINIV